MTDPFASLSEADILAMVEKWPHESRDYALAQVKEIMEGKLRAWYCTRGRACDGKPHKDYDYPHARGDQWPPVGSDWDVWFLSGGRGSGKTRTGAEYTRRMAKKVSRIALIAPTGADVRDTMIEGVSGLQYVCALAGEKIHYEPSKRRITFENGCIATTFSGEEPDRLRGPQSGFAWLDEPAHMPLIEEVWSNLLFGLRLGDRPHVVLTSTPLPTKWVKERAKDPRTRLVRVSTFANIDNLAESYQRTVQQFVGTRKGMQELEGAILADVEGSLWKEGNIIHDRTVDPSDMDRIVIGIDPAGSVNKRSDETGIVVVGLKGSNGYVLEDASDKYTPNGWAEKALKLGEKYNADAIIAEKNFGGDMVMNVIERAIRPNTLPPRLIVGTATRSKQLRAEPIVMLYEQGRVFHSGTTLANLEDEMLTWIPGQGASPNRVDALVWALTELMKPTGEASLARPKGSIGDTTIRRGLGGAATRRRG